MITVCLHYSRTKEEADRVLDALNKRAMVDCNLPNAEFSISYGDEFRIKGVGHLIGTSLMATVIEALKTDNEREAMAEMGAYFEAEEERERAALAAVWPDFDRR